MAKFEYNEYEIPLSKFFKIIHRYTERIKIYVVADHEAIKDGVKCVDFYLTRNAYESEDEAERLLKYYGDAPIWNVHVEISTVWDDIFTFNKGKFCCASIVGNVHYSDIREGYLREKADRRKEQQRQYRKRKRQEEKSHEAVQV